MDAGGADKIGYQYEAKDNNSSKMKGAYLVPRTEMYSVPYVCHCIHIIHSKFSDIGMWNGLIHTRNPNVQNWYNTGIF
jgi:hypothetical protein